MGGFACQPARRVDPEEVDPQAGVGRAGNLLPTDRAVPRVRATSCAWIWLSPSLAAPQPSPHSVRNQVAPTREKGMENRIAKGWTSDSKSEAMST